MLNFEDVHTQDNYDVSLEMMQNAAAADILKDLGPLSDKEIVYYNNPDNFKAKT